MNEMILSKNIRLSMDTKTTNRNCNVLILGGERQKQKDFILSNLIPGHNSYIVIDKDETYREKTQKLFEDKGYNIKLLNFADPKYSNKYNPLSYLNDDADTLAFIQVLLENIGVNEEIKNDCFAMSAYEAILMSILTFLREECDPEICTMFRVYKILESLSKNLNALDIAYEELKEEKPNSLILERYNFFKETGAKLSKKIIDDACEHLLMFADDNLSTLMNDDNIDIASVALENTILYIKPDSIVTNQYNSIIPIFLTQLNSKLVDVAGPIKLPRPVRIILDEFGTYGVIPDFIKNVAVSRPYDMSFTIIQNLECFEHSDFYFNESLSGNSDTVIYFKQDESNAISRRINRKLDDPLNYYIESFSYKTSGKNDSVKTKFKDKKMKKKNVEDSPARILNNVKILRDVESDRTLKDNECLVLVKGSLPFIDETPTIENCASAEENIAKSTSFSRNKFIRFLQKFPSK